MCEWIEKIYKDEKMIWRSREMNNLLKNEWWDRKIFNENEYKLKLILHVT